MAAAGPLVASAIGDYLAYQAIVSFAMILPTMLLAGMAFPIGLHSGRGRRRRTAATRRRASGCSIRSTSPPRSSVRSAPASCCCRCSAASARCGCSRRCHSRARSRCSRSRRHRRTRLVSAIVIAIAFAGVFAVTPDPFAAHLAQRYPEHTIVWRREAVQATVSVHQDLRGDHTLHVSGNHQAGGKGSFHHVIGNLPMIVHPEAREALVIGLGGGATAGALSQHTGVNVDVVELSREVDGGRRPLLRVDQL